MEKSYLKGKILFNTISKVDYLVSTAELCMFFKGNVYSIELFRIKTSGKPINYILARVAQEVWNNKKYRALIMRGDYSDVELYAIDKLYELNERCKISAGKSRLTVDRYSLNITMTEDFDICAFSITDITLNNPTIKMDKLADKDKIEIPESKVLLQIYKTSHEIKFDIVGTGGIILHSQTIKDGKHDLGMYSYASIVRGIRMTTRQFKDNTWLYVPNLSESIILSHASRINNLIDLINESELKDGAQIMLKLIDNQLELEDESDER